jgi:bifunctional non-homologous end joining protein LigD
MSKDEQPITVRGVDISKPGKELIPGRDGAPPVSKSELAEYYSSVAEVMLPYLKDRPVNMQRFPDGVTRGGFYEKKAPAYFPDWVDTVEVHTADGKQRQVVVDTPRALVYLAQQACVTPHTWLSRADRLEQPDQLVFDLDPSTDDLSAVRRATMVIGELVDELGLTSFVKTTGSRGYHVVLPLRPKDDFDRTRQFARDVAELAVTRNPDLLTVAQRKDDRGQLVYVDVMRNGYGQTAVPAFAVRPRPGGPVSTPIAWDEVGRVGPAEFTVSTLGKRLARRDDPWNGFRRRAQGLDRARVKLNRAR